MVELVDIDYLLTIGYNLFFFILISFYFLQTCKFKLPYYQISLFYILCHSIIFVIILLIICIILKKLIIFLII